LQEDKTAYLRVSAVEEWSEPWYGGVAHSAVSQKRLAGRGIVGAADASAAVERRRMIRRIGAVGEY
jgi:hypothetical protein